MKLVVGSGSPITFGSALSGEQGREFENYVKGHALVALFGFLSGAFMIYRTVVSFESRFISTMYREYELEMSRLTGATVLAMMAVMFARSRFRVSATDWYRVALWVIPFVPLFAHRPPWRGAIDTLPTYTVGTLACCFWGVRALLLLVELSSKRDDAPELSQRVLGILEATPCVRRVYGTSTLKMRSGRVLSLVHVRLKQPFDGSEVRPSHKDELVAWLRGTLLSVEPSLSRVFIEAEGD